eukprot:GEZU01011052.1.p2 GENE.GEZU01011052.1~~GEZU01011052.1.p2  ORF type:complete len:114 (-),score=22.70 GEZU01011052.1:113-454(-)
MFGSNATFRRNDKEKLAACERAGITLIEVPYWWDNTAASIIASIHSVRPDLVSEPPSGASPIPSEPPVPFTYDDHHDHGSTRKKKNPRRPKAPPPGEEEDSGVHINQCDLSFS